jgi:hypothetical protein
MADVEIERYGFLILIEDLKEGDNQGKIFLCGLIWMGICN